MDQLVFIFPVLIILFAIIKPRCTLTENPFTGPKFSWGLCITYSAMITIIIGVGLFYATQFSKPVENENENEPKTSKDIVSGLTSSTDQASLNRLAIQPFKI